MSQKGHTKDEKFMVALYEAAMIKGGTYEPSNRFVIGTALGIHLKAINTICRLLLQANFIKKSGEEDVYLTPHGLNLVRKLQED